MTDDPQTSDPARGQLSRCDARRGGWGGLWSAGGVGYRGTRARARIFTHTRTGVRASDKRQDVTAAAFSAVRPGQVNTRNFIQLLFFPPDERIPPRSLVHFVHGPPRYSRLSGRIKIAFFLNIFFFSGSFAAVFFSPSDSTADRPPPRVRDTSSTASAF